jgi:hypothetical protein
VTQAPGYDELPAMGMARDEGLDTYDAPAPRPSESFAQAFAGLEPVAAAPSPIPAAAPAPAPLPFASSPLAQQAAAPVAQRETTPRPVPRHAVPAGEDVGAAIAAADGTHLIQLGSFSSDAAARRAWTIYVSRHPALAQHEMVITEAVVRGRRYWRVSAGGFDVASSRSMCRTVNASSSDGCIAWAAASPLPGAVDTGVRFARR